MLQFLQNDVFIYMFLLQLWMLSSQGPRLSLQFLGLSFVLGTLQRSIGCQTTYWGLLSAFRFSDFLALTRVLYVLHIYMYYFLFEICVLFCIFLLISNDIIDFAISMSLLTSFLYILETIDY